MKKRVLVMDDDEVLCEELAEALAAEGYGVDMAFDGIRGKAMIAKGNYDLVLLDIKVPHFSGLELLKNMKSYSPETAVPKVAIFSADPVVHRFLTQQMEPGDSPLAFDLQRADAVISKSYSVEEFLTTVRKLLGGS
ncbi:MAG: response regulator transcription factor [Candidatus Omnitrophota bacterium]